MVHAHVLKRAGYKFLVLGLKKTLLLIAAIVLLIFAVPITTRAATFPIVAKYVEPTQLKVDWDGINNAACEHGVACNPDDPLSYVLDVNTLEQRDVLHFYDMGYNIGIIDWATPLEVGHTYKVQMHDPFGHFRVSQEFVYTPTAHTNVADGATLVSQLNISSITNPILTHFVPALPAIDENCLLNGVYDLSVDVYLNGLLKQTITGNCTYGLVSPDALNFYTNNLYGNGNYNFVVRSASTGNIWRSNDYNYIAPVLPPHHPISGWPGTAVQILSASLDTNTGNVTLTLNQNAPRATCSSIVYVDAYTNTGDGCFAVGNTVTAHFKNPPTDVTYPAEFWILFEENGVRYGYTDSTFTVDFGNVAPTVTFTADNPTLNEGETFTASGSFSDPDSTAWTATVDYGDGSGVQSLTLNPDKTFSLSHLYVDNGSYTISVSVTDNGNLTGTSTGSGGSVVVNNPAPVVPPITPPSNPGQGSPAVINVSFSDYGNQTHTAVINWGDGSGNQSVPVSGNDFSSGHNYQNPGTYTVTVIITDSEGATTTQTLTITVLNVAPAVGAIDFPSSVAVASSTPLSVNFTDQGIADTHTATINWGDGQTTNGVVSETNGSGSVSGSHTYASAGNYTVTVAVTDDDGGVGQNTTSTTAVNQISTLSPAGIWIGLKNSDDVGTKFDLKVEAYKDSTLVASGQLDSFAGGSSGFNNAHLATIPFNSFSPVNFPSGSVLGLKVYVRNACLGSGHNSGVARLWFNDSAANSRFSTTIGGSSSDYYLRDAFALATTAGPGPKKTVDVQAGAKCSAFKPFGTWSKTL